MNEWVDHSRDSIFKEWCKNRIMSLGFGNVFGMHFLWKLPTDIFALENNTSFTKRVCQMSARILCLYWRPCVFCKNKGSSLMRGILWITLEFYFSLYYVGSLIIVKAHSWIWPELDRISWAVTVISHIIFIGHNTNITYDNCSPTVCYIFLYGFHFS